MIRPCFVAALASGLFFHLGGCHNGPASPSPEISNSGTALAPAPVDIAPHVPSSSRDPVVVMKDLAATIKARDWRGVRAFWGDKGERSGMDEAAFAAQWGTLLSPKVTVGAGSQEGGAGSLYYTAPITIVDSPRTYRGEITIRRVNDVDGASAEQLRWHVESTTLRF